ncbi:MAG: helix-hairpin-helix domain-containing protein [Clostridia bacterium]|nr:helix-hairpin-helix domain-containing protein [Clostridia bacterium]
MKNQVKYELYLIAAALVITAAVVLFIVLSAPPLTPVSVDYSTTKLTADIWETSTTVSSTAATTKVYGKINVNTASATDLCELKGIGEVTANRIVEYRQQHGNFTKPEDLLNVKGIGEKKLEAIRDFICF